MNIKKLTKEQVQEVRDRRRAWEEVKDLAEEFGVSGLSIRRICYDIDIPRPMRNKDESLQPRSLRQQMAKERGLAKKDLENTVHRALCRSFKERVIWQTKPKEAEEKLVKMLVEIRQSHRDNYPGTPRAYSYHWCDSIRLSIQKMNMPNAIAETLIATIGRITSNINRHERV